MKKLILAVACALSTLAQAHFFKVETFTNHTQNIYLVSDFHRSTTKENKQAIAQQQKDLLELAKNKKAGVIVEDGMIYGDQLIYSSRVDMIPGCFDQKQLQTIEIETPQHGLASQCKNNRIECINAERRFSSFRPLNIYCEFFQNKKKEFLSSTDGRSFQNYYQEKINFIEKTIEQPLAPFFNQCKNQKCTLGDFFKTTKPAYITGIDTIFKAIDKKWSLKNLSYNDKLSIILTNYAAYFLDLEILHSLASMNHKQNVIICAGDLHINNLKEALPQLGYTHRQKEGENLLLQNGSKYIEPTALNMKQALGSMPSPAPDIIPVNPFNPFAWFQPNLA